LQADFTKKIKKQKKLQQVGHSFTIAIGQE
jgi:hypothetical protein